ncbi:MAG: hypothetical protein ABI665_05280 [Vicinamibacterales bacterium]
MLRTMQTRTVVLIGTLSLAAGWLVGTSSISQDRQAPAGSTTARRGPRPLGSSRTAEPLAPFTEQLRQKMQDVPRSPKPGRNPFSFGARRPPMAAARGSRHADAPADVDAAVDAPPAPAPFIAARPRFELSGIASTERDRKSTLTAILLDNGSLVFAVVGEKLAGGYVVAKVGETSVVITDPFGVEQTVSLKQ